MTKLSANTIFSITPMIDDMRPESFIAIHINGRPIEAAIRPFETERAAMDFAFKWARNMADSVEWPFIIVVNPVQTIVYKELPR